MSVTADLAEAAPVVRQAVQKRAIRRPAEILDAATVEFADKGFAQTRLEDVAGRLGLARGTLYRYYADKEDLFRAVVIQTMAPHVQALRTYSAQHPASVADLLRGLAPAMAKLVSETRVGGILRTVIAEARSFPSLARVWHDQLMAPAIEILAEVIAAGQARGEIRPGDPAAMAFQTLSPLITAILWHETFVPAGAPAFDLQGRLAQCVETFLLGALEDRDRRGRSPGTRPSPASRPG